MESLDPLHGEVYVDEELKYTIDIYRHDENWVFLLVDIVGVQRPKRETSVYQKRNKVKLDGVVLLTYELCSRVEKFTIKWS